MANEDSEKIKNEACRLIDKRIDTLKKHAENATKDTVIKMIIENLATMLEEIKEDIKKIETYNYRS